MFENYPCMYTPKSCKIKVFLLEIAYRWLFNYMYFTWFTTIAYPLVGDSIQTYKQLSINYFWIHSSYSEYGICRNQIEFTVNHSDLCSKLSRPFSLRIASAIIIWIWERLRQCHEGYRLHRCITVGPIKSSKIGGFWLCVYNSVIFRLHWI